MINYEIKTGVWLFGITGWIFGIYDRSTYAFSNGFLDAVEITQLLTAITFFLCWIILKPNVN